MGILEMYAKMLFLDYITNATIVMTNENTKQ